MDFIWFWAQPWVLPVTIVVLVVAVLAVLYFTLLFSPEVGRGVMLDCPHCGKPTPAARPKCQSCGRSFRAPPRAK